MDIEAEITREMTARGFVRTGAFWAAPSGLRFRPRRLRNWFTCTNQDVTISLNKLRGDVDYQIKVKQGLAEKRPEENAHHGHEQGTPRTP